MKHFKEGNINLGYSDKKGIILKANNSQGAHGVFSVSKVDDDIVFFEECDGVYFKSLTKKQALEMLDELRDYIVNN